MSQRVKNHIIGAAKTLLTTLGVVSYVCLVDLLFAANCVFAANAVVLVPLIYLLVFKS